MTDKAYIGVKMIHATPMTLLDHNLDQGGSIDPDTYPDPHVNGYQVCYEDGYISWSPKEPFESAYREAQSGCMSFGLALEAAKHGYCVSRKDWDGKFVFMCPHARDIYNNSEFEGIELPYLSEATAEDGNVQAGWAPEQSDMLRDDWMILGAGDSEIETERGFLMNEAAREIPAVEASVVKGIRGSDTEATGGKS
jgi:hypothetical protein